MTPRVRRTGFNSCAAVIFAVAFGCIAGGCSKAGRSLLRADVTADAGLTDLAKVTVRVSSGGKQIASQIFSWTNPKISVGVFLADDVSGSVTVTASGQNSVGGPIASAAVQSTSIQPGQPSEVVNLVLQRTSSPPPDGGTPDSLPSDPGVLFEGGTDTSGPPDMGTDTAPFDAGTDTAPPLDAGQDTSTVDVATDLPIVVTNPPSLTKCMEIEHAGPKAGCDTMAGTGDFDIRVGSLAFSPSGLLMASAGADGRIKLWKVNGTALSAEGRVLTGMGQPRISFSPDGKLVAVGGAGGDLFLYDLTANLRTTLTGHTENIRGVAFSSDGKRLVTVDRLATVKTWDVVTHQSTRSLQLFSGLAEVWSFSIVRHDTGEAVWAAIGFTKVDAAATGTGGTLAADAAYVWFGNLAVPTQSTLLSADTDEVDAIAISPDDKFLLAGGASSVAHVWNIQTPAAPQAAGMVPAALDIHSNAIPLTALSFGLDGRFLAVSHGGFNYGGALRIVDASNWQQRTIAYSTYYGVSVALRPQGDLFVAGEVACALINACAD